MITTGAASDGPLAGVRVVDLTGLLPGPLTTRLLADLGAEIIKIEPPAGDAVTSFMPGVYQWLNRGKRVIRADLKAVEDRRVVGQLVETADVFLEAFRPGVAERLGFGFDAVCARRPDIVYCSISSHGQDGPNRDRPGHNLGFEAAGGVYAMSVLAGETPTPSPVASADVGGAMVAAMMISAAIHKRAASGPAAEPQRIDVSLEEVIAFTAAPRWGSFLATGEAPDPMQSATRAPGMGIFKTADGGWVTLAAVEDRLWQVTCEALQLESLADDRYASHSARMADAAVLRKRIADAIATHTVAELVELADQRGLPLEPIRTLAEVRDDPHLRARGAVVLRGCAVEIASPAILDGRRSYAQDRAPDPESDRRWLLAQLGAIEVRSTGD
jgi:crotonobetainyl-CoA:carnitine CoA-transferase CaiB-like acyl-CoA transferase